MTASDATPPDYEMEITAVGMANMSIPSLQIPLLMMSAGFKLGKKGGPFNIEYQPLGQMTVHYRPDTMSYIYRQWGPFDD